MPRPAPRVAPVTSATFAPAFPAATVAVCYRADKGP